MNELSLATIPRLILDCGFDERSVELPWVCSRLRYSGNLLDVGCTTAPLRNQRATFIEALSSLRVYRELAGVDLLPCALPSGCRFWQGDVRTAGIPAGHFHEVTCISVLEHVGLAAYGNEVIDPKAPREVLLAMLRLLQQGGHLLLTIPYGKAADDGDWIAVYDEARLTALLEGIEPQRVAVEYFRKMEADGYSCRAVSREVAAEARNRRPDGSTASIGWMWGLACLEIAA